MCNLYSMTKGQAAIIALTRAMTDRTGNLAPMTDLWPDKLAPIVRNESGERVLTMTRWGMPSSAEALYKDATKRADKLRAKGKEFDFNELLRMDPDKGTTNVRNTKSKHWKRWLGQDNRCIVPFTSFSEFDASKHEYVWFALGEERPLAFFAGIWVPGWTSVRSIKEGETTNDLFGFLTTTANAEVGSVHPKAMPVVLTTAEEVETWMTAPTNEALALQRPLPDGTLGIVARGPRKDSYGLDP